MFYIHKQGGFLLCNIKGMCYAIKVIKWIAADWANSYMSGELGLCLLIDSCFYLKKSGGML